jgi:hypothetical protein
MAHFHSVQHFKFDMDAVAGGIAPLPFKSILNNAVFMALSVIRMGRAAKPAKIAQAEATRDEAAEQLRILKAVTPEAHEAWLEEVMK